MIKDVFIFIGAEPWFVLTYHVWLSSKYTMCFRHWSVGWLYFLLRWRWHEDDIVVIAIPSLWQRSVGQTQSNPWIKISVSKKTARRVKTMLCSGKCAQQTLFQTFTRISIFVFLSLQITNREFAFNKGQKVALYLIKKTRGWKHSIGVLQNSPSSTGLRTST